MVVMEPLHQLDRLAVTSEAEPVELIDDVGAGPMEGELIGGRDRGVVQSAFERGDVFWQAVVADDELELAALGADGELDRALFAGRIRVFDCMAGRGDDAIAELRRHAGLERPLFERFPGKRGDAREEVAIRC